MAIDRKLIGQTEFAEFLQDHEHDIENPPLDWMCVDPTTATQVLDALNLHDDLSPRDANGDYLKPEDVTGEEGDADEDRYIPHSALQKLRKIRFGSATLLTRMAANIEVSAASKAVAKYDPKSGAKTILFEDENSTSSGGRPVKVPDMFFLNIPVFEADEPRLIPVRLLYRVKGEKVVWAVDIVNVERIIRRAIEAVASRVAEETYLPVYAGAIA